MLVGGEPGVGKSTLLLMALRRHERDEPAGAARHAARSPSAQVKLRAARLGGAERVEILAETELDAVCATLERERPAVCVIDSVQTLYSAELGSAPGSVGQVREAAGRLLRVAKENGVATILVGHVTKDGAVAGPRVLEHLVDCVLQFEGDRYHAHRILRAAKNRFGSTNELGVFEMTGEGLVGVPDPSELFGRTTPGEVGAAVACALEGTRPILLEIQALVAPTDLAMPRRVGTGVDPKRLAMIVAVLSRHAGLPLGARGRLRQRRRRPADRRAGRRPRHRARDRLRRAERAGAGRAGRLRRDRADGSAASGGAVRAAARGVREARHRRRGGARSGDPQPHARRSRRAPSRRRFATLLRAGARAAARESPSSQNPRK